MLGPNTRFAAARPAALIGPKRSPLGLAADPGGFPLYKNGVLVGAIGVMADGDYGFDPNILDIDNDAEEAIALAGRAASPRRTRSRADQISVDGTPCAISDAADAGLHRAGTPISPPAGGPGRSSRSPATTPAARSSPAQAYGSEARGTAPRPPRSSPIPAPSS